MVPYILLVLSACGAVWLVCRHDRYRPKTVTSRVLAIALGFAAMSIAARAEEWTFSAFEVTSPYALSAFGAVEEELLKLLAVAALAVMLRIRFEDPMAGIIYGSMAGLGMALEESVYYLRQLPSGSLLLPPEEFVRIAGHMVMGGISAYGLGAVLRRQRHGQWILPGCLAASIALHLGFDWIILAPGAGVSTGTLESWSAAALMLAGFVLYGALLAVASEQARLLFNPAGPSRLWGWPFSQR